MANFLCLVQTDTVEAVEAAVKDHPEFLEMMKIRRSTSSGEIREYRSGLHVAARYGREAVIELLVRCGSRTMNTLDSDNRTPLHWAVIYDQTSAVERLLQLEGQTLLVPDQIGRTPFHSAVEYGSEITLEIFWRLFPREVLGLLNQPDTYGFAPLHLAAGRDSNAISKWLLRIGASNINAPNADGLTPFHIAARSNRNSILRQFLRSGYECDINALTKSGLTAYDLTTSDSTAELLRAIGITIPAKRARDLKSLSEQTILKNRFRVYFQLPLLIRLLDIL